LDIIFTSLLILQLLFNLIFTSVSLSIIKISPFFNFGSPFSSRKISYILLCTKASSLYSLLIVSGIILTLFSNLFSSFSSSSISKLGISFKIFFYKY
jgi:hypothetical protein